jgi:phosphonate transport system ATP-binding protein
MSAFAAIEIVEVSKTFGDRPALSSVSLSVGIGERVGLLGASGSGKSTLLRLISGLERSDSGSGRIAVLGREVQRQGRLAADIRDIRREMSVIFQQFNLVGRLSLLGNVLLGRAGSLPLWRAICGRFKWEDQIAALDALQALGLLDQAFQRASTLSGGQQQRGAIARALLQGARVVLADEPVASLDPQSALTVMEKLAELNSAHGITVVTTLHQVELARRYCTRVVALRAGRIVHDGPPESLDAASVALLYGHGSAA